MSRLHNHELRRKNYLMRKINHQSGFTLIELLMVIVIIGLMATASVPIGRSVLQANSMNQVGATLLAEFEKSRQLASARGRVTELRFYKSATATNPNPEYRRMQIYLMDQYGEQSSPIDRIIDLPREIYLSSDAAYSTLLAKAPLNGTQSIYGNDSMPYVAFRFTPTGAAELPSGNWFVTALLESEKSSGKPPLNYACVKVNPITGYAELFRP